jgi:hypothetical protein
MIAELVAALVAKYNEVAYDGGDLKDTAPIYFGTAPDKAPYPFTSLFLPDARFDFSFCSDFGDFLIQFSVFDNGKSPANVLLIQDAVYEGFNNTPLAGLDGTQLRLEPVSVNTRQNEDEDGHIGVIQFKLVIEKVR